MPADPRALLDAATRQLWTAAQDAVAAVVADAADPLGALGPADDVAGTLLEGRLLQPLATPPEQSHLLRLVAAVLGGLPEGGPVRWHGWQRAAGGPRGLALCATSGAQRAVLALSPGPVVDLVVLPGGLPPVVVGSGAPWRVAVDVTPPAGQGWEATWTPGAPAVPAVGTANLTVSRTGPVDVGPLGGPGVSWTGLEVTLGTAPPATPLTTRVRVDGLVVRVVPDELRGLLGTAQSAAATVALAADRRAGLRFDTGSARVPIPGGLRVPGVETRDLAVELELDGSGVVVRPTASVVASLPGVPATLTLADFGLTLPLRLGADGVGLDATALRPVTPEGIGVDLGLGPVSGGGYLEHDGGEYGGVLDFDLGPFSVQAMGLVRLPRGEGEAATPLSLLVVLSGRFPPPGIQLGFGFALDAVGGLVGINRRVDDGSLRALVSEGNVDRIMFPDDALERAEEIVASLRAGFPEATGHHVVGPMLRLSWGGRMVRASVAVLLELPDPVRVIVLGRVEVGIPDPAVPLVHLQAGLFGRIDPGIPLVEVLVSLQGSQVAGIPVTGELYALFRGGADPTMVLSAGGFHPRYVRPAGVPQLRRIAMDLGGGALGLRVEGYLALTSNSLQFGGQAHLDYSIAGCGVEGHLGLDALCVTEPALAFSVQVSAGVAVLAFGERLAGVSLRFTLEGPGAWHAFGSGSISILWWDVELDFDVRWGSGALPTPPAKPIDPELAAACLRPESWATVPATSVPTPVRLAEWAEQDVTAGRLARPEARFRFSQQVVPLDVEISRFHRLAVPAQTWSLDEVRDDATRVKRRGPVTARFVPGEFFALRDDDQLGQAAFVDHRCGAELEDLDPTVAATAAAAGAVMADETFETDYQVEAGWWPAQPSPRRFLLGTRLFGIEWYTRLLSAGERRDVWRAEQRHHVGGPVVTLRGAS